MMNKYLLLFVFTFITAFIPFNAFSSNRDGEKLYSEVVIDDFTVATETEPAECNTDGQVSFIIVNGEADVDFQVSIYRLPDVTTPVTVLNEDGISGNITMVADLAAAEYYAEIQKVNSSSEQLQKEVNFEIESNVSEALDFSVTNKYTCPSTLDGDDYYTFTVSTVSGTIVEYSLYQDGALIAGPQSSNEFDNVEPGTYTVQVVSNCGATKNETYIVSSLSKTYEYDPIVISSSLECNQEAYRPGISADSDILVYPVTSTSVITYPDNTTETFVLIEEGVTGQATDLVEFGNVYYSVFQDENTVVVTTITDACGKEVTDTFTDTLDINPSTNIRGTSSVCGHEYIDFRFSRDLTYPIVVTLSSFPDDFDVNQAIAAGYTDNGDGTYSMTITAANEFDSGSIGSSSEYVADGAYVFDFIDDCGITHQEIENVTSDELEIGSNFRFYCDTETAYVTLYVSNEDAVFTVIEAPDDFPFTLPYETTVQFQTLHYIYDAPPGDYVVEAVVESCDNQLLTHEFTINDDAAYESDVTVTKYCGTFGIDGTYSRVNTSTSFYVYLQKYDESTEEWENELTLNLSYSNSGTINEQNLDYGDGSYRVVTYLAGPPSVLTNAGVAEACTEPMEVLEEFEFNGSGSVVVTDYYVNECINGNLSVFIEAEGVGDINYKIISKDGVDFEDDNGTSGAFIDLEQGNYVFELTDDCGTESVSINANRTKNPRIRAVNLCEGEDGFLFAPDLDYMEYEWTKDGGSTVLGTSSTLPIDDFSSIDDIGLYQAKLTYDGSGNTCSEIIITYNVTAENTTNPEAGTGQTLSVVKSSVADVLNLFDYLTDSYDEFGYWEETTSTISGGLTDGSNLWDISSVEAGTYTFLYTVEGGCSGEDTAIVAITLIDCVQPL
ncbi:hypothetical protein JM658_13920, partial [Joostella atrarenae]